MSKRNDEIESAGDETCVWLFQHPKYKDWISRHRGLLWIKGSPGAGKSTLLKYALRRIIQTRPSTGNKALVISFFFHGRGSDLQKTPLGLFRSFLYQLLSQAPNTLSDLVQTFKQRCETIGQPGEKWNWLPHELQDFFEASLAKALERFSVLILVDAVDECGKEVAIKLVKGFQYQIQKAPPTPSQFCICFTCRHYPVLALDYGLEICVEDQNNQNIATYVLRELTDVNHNRGEIAGTIISRASGIFLWAHLLIDRVLKLELEGKDRKQIEKEIQSVPQGLKNLYQELFHGIHREHRSDSLKLMQWICFATRPLSMDELRFAMAIDPHHPYKSLRKCQNTGDYTDDNEAMERRIITLSCGLAEIRPLSNKRIVQFIHQSVNDFFMEDGMRLLDSNWESADLAIGRANHYLSRSCIRYIAMEEIGRSRSVGGTDMEAKFPFLRYATTSWLKHTEQAEAKSISQADLLGYLNGPSNDLLHRWIRVYRAMDRYSVDSPAEGSTLLHVVSKYGLMSPLLAILENPSKEDSETDSKDKNGRTPLSQAAEKGHEAVVMLLLAIDMVETDSKDKNGRTPLSWAAGSGREEVTRLLLATGTAEADSKDEGGRTPLSWAAERGSEAVVKLLLATGKVEVNSKDKHGSTPLSWAAKRGSEAVVKLLFEMGKVEADSKDDDGRTPLSWAAWKGREAVVKLLLATGKVEADSKDEYGQTPLSWAAEGGQGPVVKLLLTTGKVEADSKDEEGRTPLSWAAEEGNEAVVKLLLEKGKSEADSKDEDGRTPLSRAAQWGHEAVIKLLLATGKVEADSKDKDGRTPLSWVAQEEGEAVAGLLLATGKVKADSEDKNGRTPLSWTAEEGDEALVKALLATGEVEADSKDKDGRTPLSWAAGKGREAAVKLLLATGRVEADSKDKDGRTPLSSAAGSGREVVVKLLLTTGNVEVDSKDKDGRTPLSRAAEGGKEAVVKLLLETDKVEADLKDEYGRTPLSWAAEKGNEAIAKLLLATGKVEADSKDKDGWTPLSRAAKCGNEEIVKLLLATGEVEADSKDNDGCTPLLRAAGEGNETIVKLLLATGKVKADSNYLVSQVAGKVRKAVKQALSEFVNGTEMQKYIEKAAKRSIKRTGAVRAIQKTMIRRLYHFPREKNLHCSSPPRGHLKARLASCYDNNEEQIQLWPFVVAFVDVCHFACESDDETVKLWDVGNGSGAANARG